MSDVLSQLTSPSMVRLKTYPTAAMQLTPGSIQDVIYWLGELGYRDQVAYWVKNMGVADLLGLQVRLPNTTLSVRFYDYILFSAGVLSHLERDIFEATYELVPHDELVEANQPVSPIHHPGQTTIEDHLDNIVD